MEQGIIILNIGYGLTFVALAIREILWLRSTLTAAQAFLFGYHYFISGNQSAIFWTLVFMIVNIYMIIKIINERRPRIIPDELKDLYEGVFHQLTSKEFLYFWNMGTIKSATDDYLIHSGQTQKNLLMVLNGDAVVEVNHSPIAHLSRSSFIAEISFLTGEPASADVKAQGELIYVAWESDRLRKVKYENPGFWMKLQHALSEDLVKKVKPNRKRESQLNE